MKIKQTSCFSRKRKTYKENFQKAEASMNKQHSGKAEQTTSVHLNQSYTPHTEQQIATVNMNIFHTLATLTKCIYTTHGSLSCCHFFFASLNHHSHTHNHSALLSILLASNSFPHCLSSKYDV
jgi:hypothetical protein